MQAAVDERRRVAQEKKWQSLQSALAKFTTFPNGLTVPEMKALVLAATTSTKSLVKSKKAELQVQLYLSRNMEEFRHWLTILESPLLVLVLVILSPQMNQWLVTLLKDFLLLLLMILLLVPLLP